MLSRRSVALALVAGPFLLGTRAARAASFEINDEGWEGLSELYAIAKTELGPERVKPVATLDWSTLTKDDGVLVLHPTERIQAGEASNFMKLGGRVAVLDDFGKGDDLLRRFKIERVRLLGRPVSALRGNPELPIAEPWLEVARGQVGAPHPIVTNVKRLVLNHPMALNHPDLSPVLKVRISGEPDAIVAVAGQVEKGRLFAMSDPSALINSMLRYPGNRALAVGLIRYLASDSERGQGRLFILVNDFKQEGSVGGEGTFVEDAENAVRSAGEALASVHESGFPAWLLAVLAAIGVTGLALWVARTSGKPYKSPVPRYARPTPLVARGGVAGRFAMLAAPNSAKSLVLLELKSALFEAVSERFSLSAAPTSAEVVSALRDASVVTGADVAKLESLVHRMTDVESQLLRGGAARINRDQVNDAEKFVTDLVKRLLASDLPKPAPIPE